MQPSSPIPRGSFSKPQELVKNIEKHETTREPISPLGVKAQESEVEEQQPVQQAAPQEPAKSEDDLRQEKVSTYIKNLEEDLDIKITDEDIRSYILKGRLSKEVVLVKGLMKGTLQTIRISDMQEIDSKMVAVRDSSKFTSRGIENEEAILALSYAWTHADGKPLGPKPEDREVKIRQMGSLFIERASTARVSFETLIRLVMQERGLIKK